MTDKPTVEQALRYCENSKISDPYVLLQVLAYEVKRLHRLTAWADQSPECRGAQFRRLDDENSILRAFIRELVAIDPSAGSGEAKYFVTADFIARARALVE